MNRAFLYNLFLFCLLYSCKSKSINQNLNELRGDFSRQAMEYNKFTLERISFEDSLYKIANLNLDSGIKAIDKIIIESPRYAHYYKIKGDFYFKYHKYQSAKENYSKALELEEYTNALVLRASCSLKLQQYDSCLNDLKSFPEYNKSNYWYIGNYYETKNNVDSAVYYYEMLYKVDNTVYKYCKDRISFLQKHPNPKMFNELNLRDTGRLTLLFNP